MSSHLSFDRSQAPELEELSVILPAYEFKKLVAVGGMGAIYHAVQLSLDREVAIKILPKHFGQDPGFCQMFNEEARAMGKLNHKNLLSVFDFGNEKGYYYIVMEYVDGSSLHDAVGGRPVEDVQCAEIVRAVCDGLGHAHDAGILHRDIKPPNILLTMDCVPKVADFGLARDTSFFDQNEVVWGTLGFTAPEVVANRRAVDATSDIYSLGAVLYFLLTARIPKEKRIPASLRVQSAIELDYIIDKAMHTDPAMRYASCAELKEDIELTLEYLKVLKNQGMGQGEVITAEMIRPKAPSVGIATEVLHIPSSKPLYTPRSHSLSVPVSTPLQVPVYPAQATAGTVASVFLHADIAGALAAAGAKPVTASGNADEARIQGSPLNGMTAPVYVNAAMAEALSGVGVTTPAAAATSAPKRIEPLPTVDGLGSVSVKKTSGNYSLLIIVFFIAVFGVLLLILAF